MHRFSGGESRREAGETGFDSRRPDTELHPMEIKRPESGQPIPEHAKRVFEGDIFDVWQWEQELYDGSSKIFEKLKRDDTVTVAASTPERKLMLLKDEQPGREPVLTFPGGRMDEGE